MGARTPGLVSAKRKSATTAATSQPNSASKPAAGRRVGAETSETRTLLLDAAEMLMRDEGYAAVTSRRLGERAGVKAQLVHYYFRTMDDLFLALWRRYAEKNLARQMQALASSKPLRNLWNYCTDVQDTALGVEFMALARHRKAIRAELTQTGERFRRLQITALSQVIEDHDLKQAIDTPEILAVLVTSVSRALAMDEQVGVFGGHAQMLAWVERWLDRLEGDDAPPPQAPTEE